jgi:hypothetical protein
MGFDPIVTGWQACATAPPRIAWIIAAGAANWFGCEISIVESQIESRRSKM